VFPKYSRRGNEHLRRRVSSEDARERRVRDRVVVERPEPLRARVWPEADHAEFEPGRVVSRSHEHLVLDRVTRKIQVSGLQRPRRGADSVVDRVRLARVRSTA
jgi:hypothetical protein